MSDASRPWFASVAASRPWFAYARGRKIFLKSLINWASPPRLLAEPPADSGEDLDTMTLSPDGGRLAVLGKSGEVKIWSTAERSPRPIRVLPAKDMNVPGLAISADGSKVALFGGEFGHPAGRVWDLRAPAVAEPLVLRRSDNHDSAGIAFDPSGRWLVTSHEVHGAALWPLDDNHPYVIAKHKDDVKGVAFTPDGAGLVSYSNDCTVRVWSLLPGGVAERPLLVGDELYASGRMAADPASGRIAVGCHGHIHLARLDGSPPQELQAPGENFMHGVAFGDGGRLVAAAGGVPVTVRVWNLETGAVQTLGPSPVLATLGKVGIADAAFLGSDSLLASGFTYAPKRSPGPGLLRFDLRRGTVRVLGLSPNQAFAVSRDATFGVGVYNLFSPVRNGSELVRFSLTGRQSAPLPSHGSGVVSVALDRTGSLVASGSNDGTVRIGRVSGEEPYVFLGHEGGAWAVAFSPDGRWLASAGGDRTIRLWPVPDVSKTPLHKRPYAEFLAVLRSHTNVRAVPDTQSPTGWKLEAGPFPGWAKLPEW